MKSLTFGQLWRLMTLQLIAAPLVYMLSPLYVLSGYLGWLAIPASGLISLSLAFFSVRLSYAYQGQDWGEYGRRIVGRAPHFLFSSLLLLYCLTIATMCAASYSDLFISVYLEGTPTQAMLGCFLLCAALAARSGIRSISLLGDGFFLTVFATTLPVLTVLLGKMNYDMTSAFVTHWSATKLIQSTFFAAGWTNDLTLLLLILPHFQPVEKPFRKVAAMQALVVSVLLAYWLSGLLLFGPTMAGSIAYPVLEVVRFISFGEVLENLDPILIAIWSTTLLIKTALLLFMGARIAMRFSGFKSHRPAVFALTSLVFIFAYQFSRYPGEFLHWTMQPSFQTFTWLIFLLPALYWTIAKLRGMPGAGRQ